jgi:hypothetical protein
VKHVYKIEDFIFEMTGRVQAEFGQPGVPLYAHIDLPETNQRIEGPIRTEGAVKRLLQKIKSEQIRVKNSYKDSQGEASNQAGNVLFNYTDELKGLGWMIV